MAVAMVVVAVETMLAGATTVAAAQVGSAGVVGGLAGGAGSGEGVAACRAP